MAPYLSDSLVGVSPTGGVREGGELTRTYRCTTLLQALYLMLWLDLTGGSRLRECGLHDCAEVFRLRPQTESRRCKDDRTSIATARRARGKKV